MNIYDYLYNSTPCLSSIAIDTVDSCISYEDLFNQADLIAQGLSTYNLINKRIAILVPDKILNTSIVLSLFKLEACLIPINPKLTNHEICEILKFSGAHAVILSINISDTVITEGYTISNYHDEFIIHFSDNINSLPVNKKHAAIFFTSGTTGTPKGVVHNHLSIMRNVEQWSTVLKLRGGSRILILDGFLLILSSLYAGATVILPTIASGRDIPSIIDDKAVTTMLLFAPWYRDMINSTYFQDNEMHSLQSAFTGGESIPNDLIDRFTQKTQVHLCQVYGLTEYPIIMVNDNPAANGALGRPISDVTLKLIKNDDASITQSELACKGEGLFLGYWDRECLNINPHTDEWFKTGDLVTVDADGIYWFCDRSQDIIIRGGYNVSINEIQRIISLNAHVISSCVIPVKTSGQSILIAAFVITDRGPQFYSDELNQHLSSHLADYKLPDRMFFLDSLPLNPSGKLDRLQLEKYLLDDHLS